jgi:PAS domain S-box-containing protein
MQRLETEKRIWNHLTELIASDGHRVPASLSASSIRNSQGDVIGTLAIARNLTEQRRLEDELEARDRFMANILQDSADAIVTLDLNDVITSWNRGAEQVFGYSASEVVGKSLDLLVPPELTESRELEHIRQKLRTAGSVRSYQTERLTKDGRRIQVVFTRTAIRDDSGKFIGSSAVLKDITRVLNLERELADAGHFATLGELSAGLAHEIKNPLAGIKGAIDVIRDSLAQEDPQFEILGDVLYEVHRIDKIVRDLLSYARPKPPTHSEVCLPEIVQRIAGMVRQSSNKESVSLRVSHVTPIPSFTGDATQIEETVLNLLLNAGHAVQARGTIEVLMSYDSERAIVRLEVCDDGRGIAQEIQRKIFQPFFTTRVDGTGLGLATCLKNVQYHGGSIEVESELGRGAKFVVSLPLLCQL